MSKYIEKAKHKKAIIWLPILIVFLFVVPLFSTQVFSLDKLNLKVEYINSDGKESTWDLEKNPKFEQDWFTNNETVTFLVDLSAYDKTEEENIKTPFKVTGEYDGAALENITINKVTASGGVYKVVTKLPSGELEGKVGINISIAEDNDWGIPHGHNPIAFSITKDAIAPEIKIKGINDGEVFLPKGLLERPSSATMNISVSDSNLNSDSVFMTVNGEKINLEMNRNMIANHTFTEEGEYEVSITAKDKVGNKTTTEPITFYIHNEDPELNVTMNGKAWNGEEKYFNKGNLVELEIINTLQIDDANIVITKDGENYSKADDVDLQGNKALWTHQFTEDGNYKISINVKDNHDGKTHNHNLDSFEFIIDTVNPQINVSGIDNDAVFHPNWSDRYPTLDISISGSNLDEENVYMTVNGEEVNLEMNRKMESSYTFKEDGKHEVTVTAINKAGNKTTTKPLIFYVHTEEPALHVKADDKDWSNENTAFDGPKTIEYVIENTIPIISGDVRITKDGEPYSDIPKLAITGNKAMWKQDFTEEGNYKIDATITDDDNDSTHELSPIEFLIDTTDPEIQIIEGEEKSVIGDVSKQKEITVEVIEKNFDTDLAKIVVLNENDEVLDVKFSKWKKSNDLEDTYTSTFKFKDNGQYKIKVNVEDVSGNKATKTSKLFTVDKKVPDISIDGIEHEAHYNEDTLADIKITDNNLNQDKTSITVEKLNEDGVYVSYDAGEEDRTKKNSVRLTHTFKDEGTYRVSLHAEDDAGNKSSDKKVSFTIDKTAPILSINNLDDKAFYDGSQEVTFAVNEYNFQTNDVTFIVTRDGKDITEQIEEKLDEDWKNKTENVELVHKFEEDGFYTIELGATDKAGNSALSEKYQFTIDKTAPTIDIDGVIDDVYYDETRSVNITIKDVNLDVQTVKVTKDGKNYKVDDFTIKNEEFANSTASLKHEFDKAGDYLISLEAIDKSGNKTNKTLSFGIDKTNPIVDITSKINSHVTSDFINEKGVNSLIAIKLTELNITNKNVVINRVGIDGNKQTFRESEVGNWKEINDEEYEFIINENFFKIDGQYTINVNAEDKSGRKAKEKSFTLTVDNIAPVITLTDIKRYNDAPITEVVQINEHNFKKNNVKIEVMKENEKGDFVSYDKFDSWTNDSINSTLELLFKEDGTYKVVVNAVDDAGNRAKKKSNIFTIDTINPVLSIKGIENTDKVIHYNKNKVVTIDVQDQNIHEKGTKLEIKKLNSSTGKMEAYNINQELKFTKTSAKLSHNFTTKDEGTYSIKISSTDKSGNKPADKMVTFVIDNTAPVLSITDIKDNSFNATNKTVKISVDETNFKTNNVIFSVFKNGKDITEQVEKNVGSKWRNAKRLSQLSYDFNQDGFYEINISATDAAGNVGVSKQKSFTIDKKNPEIEISGVENNKYYNEDKRVNVTIKDVNLEKNIIRVTKNGSNYNVGNFTTTNNLYTDSVATLNHDFSQEGTYEVVVEAIDKAGNQSVQTMVFTIDKTAPVITPTMKGDKTVIQDGQFINQVFTPQFILDNQEDEIVSVQLNGGSNLAGNIPIASKEMVYHYSVLARDKAGNETTLEISFTLDTTKPTLNISGVLEGFFKDNIMPKVTFADKHLDESKTYVTLNNRPFTNGTALNAEGDYILKAVITDLANNVTERTIVFTIDKTAPVIRFEDAISDKYFNENVLPNIFIEDMSDYDIISLTLNGEPYTLGDPIETEGKHVMYFEVKDKAGNIKQLSVEFIIDKTPPAVLFNGAKEDGKYYESISLEVQLDNQEDTIKTLLVNGEIYEGEVVEQDGFKTIKLNLTEIDSYQIEVEAYDKAGNTVNSILSFDILEKSLMVKFFENKPLFTGSMIGIGLLLIAGIFIAAKSRKQPIAAE